MYKTRLQKMIVSIVLGTMCTFSMAQEPITFGSVDIIPTLNLGAAYDDNIRSEGNSTESDTLITINPAVRAQIDNGISGFSLDYSLTKGEYLSESDEDFLNQTYGASFGWNIVDTHTVNLSATLFDAHDPRSPDAPSGVSGRDELDEYEDTTYTFNYQYGDRSVLFGYSLTASLFDKEYKTNRQEKVVDGQTFPSTALNDRETKRYDAQFNINVSEALQLNLLYGLSETRYVEDASVTDDSDQQSYGVGVNWDISVVFGLNASYSEVERDLINDPTQDDATKSEQYSLGGSWSPYSYSQVTLDLSQVINEPSNTSTDQEDFVEVQSIQLAWNHDWTDVFSTNMSYANAESDFVGSDSRRVDDSDTVNLGFDYQFRRWATLNFNVRQTSRDGTQASPKSDRTAAQLGVALTL